ncbi:MAG TPA: hypothetical protein VLZ74_15490 [Methylocella sp.]|nr:hypothetical protein [Methylocella sp.]
MPNEIPLQSIDVFPSVSDAPIGALLQIAYEGPTAVLRCSQKTDEGFVVLEGEKAGIFVLNAELNYAPALNIGDLACVVVVNAAPYCPPYFVKDQIPMTTNTQSFTSFTDIPAQPGFWVALRHGGATQSELYDVAPVIGWRVTAAGDVFPISSKGLAQKDAAIAASSPAEAFSIATKGAPQS